MKLTNLTKMVYTLKLFNTGQVTLPKEWRDRFDTKNFLAEDTDEGLLIKPLKTVSKNEKNDVTYYEDNHGFGIFSKKGIDPDKLIRALKKFDREEK